MYSKVRVLLICLLLISFSLYGQESDSIKNVEVNEVKVTATRMNSKLKNIPQKIEIIDANTIQSLPSSNLAEVLKRSTNLDIVQYPGISATIGMRGFSPSAHSRSYTLVLIDGKPSGVTNIASINTDNIAQIEIVKGPYSALYGSDAMAGVINLITKKSCSENSGSVSLEAGSFGNLKIKGQAFGALSEKINFGIGFSRQQQDKDYRIGKNNLFGVDRKGKNMLDYASFGDIMENSQFEINNLFGQLAYEINNSWSTNINFGYTFGNDIETPGNYWGSYGHSKKDLGRVNSSIDIKHNTGKNIFTFSPYYNNNQTYNYTDNSDSSFVSFHSTIQEYGFKINDNLLLGDISLLLGADYDVYNYKSERFSEEATPTNPYAPDNSNNKFGFLAQAAYRIGGFDVNAGFRYDYIKYQIEANEGLVAPSANEKYNSFNPSIGVQYALPSGLAVHASFGTAFSVPEAFKVAGKYEVSEYFADWDFWWVQSYVGNPDLKPEQSKTFDLGLKFNSENGLLNADITYFQTDHTGKIVETTLETGETSFKNANSSVMSGLETMASLNIGALFQNNFKLEIYANLTTMLKTEVDETLTSSLGTDSVVTRDMLYVRKNNGSFGIFFDTYQGFSTRLNARYIGSRYEKDNFSLLRQGIVPENHYHTDGGYTLSDEIIEHPEYYVFDYSIYYTIQKNKKFGVTISNIFDENYTEKDGYNMPGRTITGSFTYSF